MEIKHLKISNFRGIKELNWFLSGKYVCLIGPGDCGKSSILDAIEFALYPSYTISFDDSDFYNCDTNKAIEIYVSVACCPDEFYEDSKFGMYLRGIKENDIFDEPVDEAKDILTIKLTVDKSLEPSWSLFTERETEIKEISHRMREKIGMMRIGNQIEKHFTWGRGSILNKWSDNIDQAKLMISEAVRKAKEGFDEKQITDLPEIIDKITKASKKFGFIPKNAFKAHLDTKSISFGYGAISLNDENIPIRQFGTGSKKLLASSLQAESTVDGAILLFDEIETGLEPYRLRNLIRILKNELKSKGQTIATTHSSVALVEFDLSNIVVVRNNNGVVSCKSFSVEIKNQFQGTFRKVPEAFFSKKVIVCEGATEFGFMLAFEDYLTHQGFDNFGYQGVSVVDGKGDTFKQIAKDLKLLGYETCVLIDSDKLKEQEIQELNDSGVIVINWAGNVSIEERVFLDVPDDKILAILEQAIRLRMQYKGEEESDAKNNLILAINSRISNNYTNIEEIFLRIQKQDLRRVLGEIAKHKDHKYFKTIYAGKSLGDVVFSSFQEMNAKDIYTKMEILKSWIYE